MLWVGLQCVIVVYPDHPPLLFKQSRSLKYEFEGDELVKFSLGQILDLPQVCFVNEP